MCAELEGNYASALEHRKVELMLIKLLYRDVSVQRYPAKVKADLLKGYGPRAVSRRKMIVKELKRLVNEGRASK